MFFGFAAGFAPLTFAQRSLAAALILALAAALIVNFFFGPLETTILLVEPSNWANSFQDHDYAERALLDYVTELTRDKKVSPETFYRLAGFYSERAICEIVWLVATEHVYNITNIGLNIHSDMLCDITAHPATASPARDNKSAGSS